MKKFTIALALLGLALVTSLSASAQYYRVVIHHSTLETPTTVINLSDNPVIRFNDMEMTINADSFDTVITIPKEAVESFEHHDLAGIDDIGADNGSPVVGEGSVSFTDLPAGSHVEVYDINGRLLQSQTAEGNYTLDLTTLGAGVFLVKVNSLTLKIATK